MGNKDKKQFVWEYMLTNEEVHFEQAQVWEPYAEIAEEVQGEQGIICKYNAMHRYEDVFMSYFMKQGIPNTAKDKVLFDVVSHYLALEEIKSGLTYKEYKKRRFGEDIEKGMYGEAVRDVFCEMTPPERYTIMHYLDLQNSVVDSGMEIYCNVLIRILDTGVIYKDCYHDKHYIFYVGEPRDTRKEKKISLVNTLFLPLGIEVEILWDKHFALLGEHQTLRLDSIRIM